MHFDSCEGVPAERRNKWSASIEKAMPSNGKCCGAVRALLLLVSIVIVCSGEFPDAIQVGMKKNQINTCMRMMDCFGIKHRWDYDDVTCNVHINGMHQDSHGIYHGLQDIQDLIIAACQGFSDAKLPFCQRNPSLQQSGNSGKIVATDDHRFQGLLQPSSMAEAPYRTLVLDPSKYVLDSSEFLLDHSPDANNVQKPISGLTSIAPYAAPNYITELSTEFIETCSQIITALLSSDLSNGDSLFQANAPLSFSTPVHRQLSYLPVDDASSRTSKRAFQHSFFYSPLAITLRDTESLDSSSQEQSPNLPFRAILPSAVSLQHSSVLSTTGQAAGFEIIQPPSYNLNATGINLKQRSHRHHRKCHHSVAPSPSINRSSISAPSSHYCHHKHPRTPIQESPGHSFAPSPAPQMGTAPLGSKPPTAVTSPPPNPGCAGISCSVPYTETPFGSPCGCVIPMQVRLELAVALYALFPLTSVLAEELAYGTLLSQNQVRITGANAEKQDEDKSVVDIDLVPLDEAFDNLTALLIFQKFQNHEVYINETLFGSYEVLYVSYPGLPPSAYPGQPPEGNNHHPLGVDIKNNNNKLHSGTIALIALSSAIVVVCCIATVWFVLLKFNQHTGKCPMVESVHTYSAAKKSGGGSMLSSDIASSTSMSFASSIATYTGSAKTFTLSELERATDNFKAENIVGEGGFGRVYCGILDDGTKVAVKVLTRDDQQGGREFISEVEMLSRLHHRNLVKLIGVCTDEHCRSLVYELIPNGSVESHLHGVDKLTSALDWDARMKIALGAARGLAYLHEDSNPRVIHRDFKASNILLEDDFTPKISDFGLAKAAPDEGSEHISTRVMGTFGYVAPEYAMTGHLLVKSDVYSYGVVLLELLTGRKPVDMSQPPGQENLVTWARPLLTSQEGLEILVDPALGNNVPSDNVARVAAIASMCVQPEVSDRPFMGEVVQALKLVYNDSDTSNGIGSGNGSQGEQSPSHDSGVRPQKPWEGGAIQFIHDSASFISADCSDATHGHTTVNGRPLSASAILSYSQQLLRELSGSFRRHSTSGPLRIHRSRSILTRLRSSGPVSMSEHALNRHFSRGLDREFYELWP